MGLQYSLTLLPLLPPQEARLKEAERREALKGGLEEQVAERRRRRQDELRQKASEAREVVAQTVRQEKEALRSQVAAAGEGCTKEGKAGGCARV